MERHRRAVHLARAFFFDSFAVKHAQVSFLGMFTCYRPEHFTVSPPYDIGGRPSEKFLHGGVHMGVSEGAIFDEYAVLRSLEDGSKPLFTSAKLGLRLFLAGDIEHDALEKHGAAGRVAARSPHHPETTRFDRSWLACGTRTRKVHPVVVGPGNLSHDSVQILGVQPFAPLIRVSSIGVRGHAKKLLNLRAYVHGGTESVQFCDICDGGDMFHEGPIFSFSLPEFFFGPCTHPRFR